MKLFSITAAPGSSKELLEVAVTAETEQQALSLVLDWAHQTNRAFSPTLADVHEVHLDKEQIIWVQNIEGGSKDGFFGNCK